MKLRRMFHVAWSTRTLKILPREAAVWLGRSHCFPLPRRREAHPTRKLKSFSGESMTVMDSTNSTASDPSHAVGLFLPVLTFTLCAGLIAGLSYLAFQNVTSEHESALDYEVSIPPEVDSNYSKEFDPLADPPPEVSRTRIHGIVLEVLTLPSA